MTAPPLRLREISLYSALYLNELLYYLLERQTAYPELFDYYRQALQLLTEAGSPEPVLRQFELLLLEALGYGIDFTLDALSGLPIEPQRYYLYRARVWFCPGARECAGCGYRFEGRHLLAMARRAVELRR